MESEDEDGEELTPGVDAAILRMLAKIKRGDPEIYEKEKAIFEGRLFRLRIEKRLRSLGRGAEKVWAIGTVKV